MSKVLFKDYQVENSFTGVRSPTWEVNLHAYSWSPPTDVFETDASFVIRVEIAGMRQSDFNIDVENNFVVISGVRMESPERRAYHQMEVRFGEFKTAVEIPAGVDVSNALADYEDGFLNVVLPKIRPTTVSIKG
jgi:HSP20 family protein